MNKSEIQEQYRWDLSDLFTSDDEWEEAFKAVRENAEAFKGFKGRILESPERLYEAIKEHEKVSRMITNVLTYARLRKDENTKNATYQSMTARAEKLATEISEMGSFFTPEILSAAYETIKEMSLYPPLKMYEQFFEDLFRSKKHTLSEEMESVLAQVGELGDVPSNTYGMLLNADMTFEDAVDAKGDPHKLTNGSYIQLMMSADRTLRQDAFGKYYKVYEGHINTIATLLQSEVNKNIFFSKVRKHPSAREAALFQNNIPTSVPDQLIEAVNANLETFYKYMKLRKKVLGLDELHLYDIYRPIVTNVDFDIPYEEAKTMVTESLGLLGENYQKTIREAFEQRWIDVYETEGKRSGAYSWGTYDSKPYILLNHKDNIDSMFTLTHELGHSMHSYLTRENQPYVYGNYSIFLAEVASTTNEALLNDYLLKNIHDEDKKKYILNHYLEQFRGTIFRQTMFAEFERDIHDHVEKGGALTAEFLCDHYLNLNKKYFGPDVVIDDAIKYEWARIPHMYYNFYVYQYATGFSAAIALSNAILKEGEPAVKCYTEFLSSGSKDYPIDILRKAGADMETEAPVNNALALFTSAVEELEALL
ncbi:oligoendopeptidase F [Alkaliphilus metalliredigens QYMF]|uniref:Oligopeptidase F n=1 Tax=Alkaliphilus metalliredigens (strain QYMF) TaxID=293826 RepID=A6TUL8_ALKMQ|nr:oligoendopeptidase F [Alkaliphilus metalliredigens]ABR49886.1 oligoendopeptidase F [Alkaliphilus metalliredigens QYMF]